ncbi:MAG: peptidoglycan DD-metalloendopeptidase family protein [Alphaproteobacteria bacterium]|jgi:murein DD-endopeptidase MepM/ murein hydrolase activator NlpD|nr:peptidoglycan DD-metalloendopeptidase family protein [Alphaproteobacteria bacterium]
MEKIKLILQGCYHLVAPFIKALSYVGYNLLFLFIKIAEIIAIASSILMQVIFSSIYDVVIFIGKGLYYIVSVVIKLILALINSLVAFVFASGKFILDFSYQLIISTAKFIKNFTCGAISFVISFPFRIIYFYFQISERLQILFKRIKKSYQDKRRWSFVKHQYKHYLKKHILLRVKVINNTLSKVYYKVFNSTKLFIFKINLIFKKVIYNIQYVIKNSITFITNLVLLLSLLLKSSFLVITSIFTKDFWYKFFNRVYSLKVSLKHLSKVCYFESRVFIKHSKVFIRNLLLFLWLDILNFKRMGFYIKNNLIKFFATLILVCFLMYGFIMLVFNYNQYEKLSQKYADTFVILNTPNLLSKVVNSELFQPLIYYKDSIKVDNGSNLYSALLEKGIDINNALVVVDTLKKSYDLRKINPSWVINTVIVSSSEWESNKVQKLSLPVDTKFDLIIEADNDYNYTSYTQEKKLTRYILRRKTLVKDSIYSSAVNSGISPNVVMEVFKVLSWDVDFQRDIKENNSLEVIFECIYNENDDLVSCDNLLFASIVGDKTISFYKFNGEYYHADGRSVVKTLVKTPINNARLSSSFGVRKHPVLGYTAAHKGVDFAAPTGTPIYAGGAGTIVSMYRSASYGNYIRIRHNPYLSSAYAHMNGFVKGLKIGDKVNQWQVIGYVGSTGIATGPHLHYEILVNGKQINPLTIKMPSTMKLSKEKLQDFNDYKATFNNIAIRIPTRGKIVSPLGDVNFDGNFNKPIK